MSSVVEIEDSIRALPAREFLRLADWMCDRHLEVISSDGFEAPGLEDEIAKGLEGPRHPVDDAFYADLRKGWTGQ